MEPVTVSISATVVSILIVINMSATEGSFYSL